MSRAVGIEAWKWIDVKVLGRCVNHGDGIETSTKQPAKDVKHLIHDPCCLLGTARPPTAYSLPPVLMQSKIFSVPTQLSISCIRRDTFDILCSYPTIMLMNCMCPPGCLVEVPAFLQYAKCRQ